MPAAGKVLAGAVASMDRQSARQQPRSTKKLSLHRRVSVERPTEETSDKLRPQLQKTSSTPSLPQLSPKVALPRQSQQTLGKFSYTVQFGNNSGLVRSLFKKRRDLFPALGDSGNSAGKLSLAGNRLEVTKAPQDAPGLGLLWTAWRSEDVLDAMASGSNVYVSLNTSRLLELQPFTGSASVSAVRAHNHFDGNPALVRKMELRETIVEFFSSRGRDPFGVIPQTFVVRGSQDPEFQRWKARYAQEKAERDQRVWLVKPGKHSNQGRGIEVYDTIDGVQQYVDSKDDAVWVVQKYIEEPLLLAGRKFDLRMYCLVTQEPKGGTLHAHFFNDGYVRTTSAPYSTETLDRAVHITNDQVQRTDKDYGKFEEGNKMSLADLQAYIVKQHGAAASKSVIQQMKAIAIDTVHAAKDKLNPRNIDNCFELFGFDYMIDSACRVWLLEVNTDPSLEVHSRHQQMLIPAMVDGLLQLTIDRIFGLKADVTQVHGMRWEHIYSSAEPESSPDAVACDWVAQVVP